MSSTTTEKPGAAKATPEKHVSEAVVLNRMPSSEENARKKNEAATADREGRTFTYIGAGEDSPRVINFMGKQRFVRGDETEVFDPDLIAKLKDNPTFVEGKADQEVLHRIDEEGKTEADLQRKSDRKVNAAYSKRHSTE